jgi:hypothetical protein
VNMLVSMTVLAGLARAGEVPDAAPARGKK